MDGAAYGGTELHTDIQSCIQKGAVGSAVVATRVPEQPTNMASPNIKSKHSIVCNYKQLSWTEEPIAVSRSLPTKYHTAVTERRFSGDIEGFGVATYVM